MCVCCLPPALKLGSQDQYRTSTPFSAPEAVALEHVSGAHLPTCGPPGAPSSPAASEQTPVDPTAPPRTSVGPTHARPRPLAFRYSLSLDFQVIVAGVAHLTEAGHKEVVAPMIGRGVLLDVGKLHKLSRRRERSTER